MARRSLLFLLFVLCFGLSVPALAVPGDGGGNDNGQGGGPPTTSATATTAATTTAATTTATTSGHGQGGGPPSTTATTSGNGQGGGPPSTTATTSGNGQGGGPPTTTATTTGSGDSGNGQGSVPPVTDTTANGNANGTANGQGNGDSTGQSTTTTPRTATTARQAPIADPLATNDDTGRVATFLAASQIPVETDTGSAPPATSEGQSAPERMISWLLTGNEQRFLPIVASPFVALMVVGRALTSAGSGAIAPLVLLGAVGFTKLLDRRRAKSLVPIAFLP